MKSSYEYITHIISTSYATSIKLDVVKALAYKLANNQILSLKINCFD